ncbi:MAG: multifunctional CCA addition/repair protein [Succinivibrionaceae bacterium]|nr:multifunctional CCA addition/repair protein [Succinivibrionaceae bacterium]
MEVYLVGGAVRDRLLGAEPGDRDYVVVGATVGEMLAQGYTQVGRDFPVFLHPRTHEEYALARTERKSGTGYHGFVCDFSPTITLEEDLLRRDLTINALAEDQDGRIIDPYGGQEDLRKRILRHVSSAFGEDPLRVLRVARFAARLAWMGFRIASETLELMRTMSEGGELATLTPERVFMELQKALASPNPEVFIRILRNIGALREVLPELNALYGVPGPRRWHPEIDSGIHTVMTLKRMAQESTSVPARFAILCHDLGKGLTPREQWPHHPDHCEKGLAPLKRMCERLHVPTEYRELAEIVVRYHGDMHHLWRKGPEGVVDLLYRLDAFRRPERIRLYALCCKCDFLGRRGFESRPFPRADYLLALHSLLLGVDTREFVAQGLRGAAIGEAMRQRRVELCREFMKTLPRGESDDTHNLIQPYDSFRQ